MSLGGAWCLAQLVDKIYHIVHTKVTFRLFVSMLKKELKYASKAQKIIIIIKSYDKMHLLFTQ